MVVLRESKLGDKTIKITLSPYGEAAWYFVVRFLVEQTTDGNPFSEAIAFMQCGVVALVAHQAYPSLGLVGG